VGKGRHGELEGEEHDGWHDQSVRIHWNWKKLRRKREEEL
jgi:hypothetical protein